VAVSHELSDGHEQPHTLSRRVAFVELHEDGTHERVGPVYLDYRAPEDAERARVQTVLSGLAFADGGAEAAEQWAMVHLVPEHVAQVRDVHGQAVERSRAEVQERLGGEVRYWRGIATRGGSREVSAEAAERRAASLESRLGRRLRDLEADAQVVVRLPQVLATALVVPESLLRDASSGHPQVDPGALEEAVRAVEEIEERLGNTPVDAPGRSRGEVRSVSPDGSSRWIGVNVQPEGRSIRISRTALVEAMNLGDRFRLALVQDTGRADGEVEVRYAVDPFRRVRLDAFDQHTFGLAWSSLWRSGEQQGGLQ
jgi:hypothetical protein